MRKLNNLFIGVAALTMTSTAMATAIDATDNFFKLYEFLNNGLAGGLGMGIALAALLIGAGVGAAKASAMPAISGIVIGAIFGFGPSLLLQLINGGAIL